MKLTERTRDEVRASIDAMPAEMRAQVSADYLALLEKSPLRDPWVHGFNVLDDGGLAVGLGGYKGPPVEGMVEIAYAINPDQQGKGYATAAARALVAYAFGSADVKVVRAHTLPDGVASQRVLEKSGFRKTGELVDPEDGPVWRFEIERTA
jgi:[ribosomal protein S5]-alanine N-acetyltransferase